MTYYDEHKKERNVYQKIYDKIHRKKLATYQKIYRQTEAGKMVSAKASKKTRQKYPERRVAGNAVSSAIQRGKLIKSVFCEECGLPAETEGHHPDYSKPLEIEWLCRKCHVEKHKG